LNHLLDKLNPQQREAAETVHGPLLILAGAGSGKTRVITYRIAHLVENIGKPADSILAVTFTNKAAAEMGERVSKLIAGRSLAQPTLSTFHSFCVRVLRRDIETLRIGDSGFKRDFAIYDEADQQALIKSAMKRLGIDDKQLKPRAVLSQISWAKSHMLDPQEIYLQSADPKTERVAHIYEIYRQELRKANALDFDDLLLETVRLLKSSAEVREKYNRRYQFILIDEYQDTNRPQYELVKLLGAGHQNVCVVGDEDQSIYSWRGADIKNILEFERDFPNAKVIRLEQNYRSTQTILEAASAVVSNNKQRKGKNLWTSRQGGGKIGYYEAPDGENEALFVADYISKYMKQAGRDSDAENPPRAAVLYRTNFQSRLFEEALRRYGLKYNVVGGFSFYERSEIKDMISYLKLVNNIDDSIALLRVVNTPARGIGKATMDTIERIALETGLTLWAAIGHAIKEQLLPGRACAALKSFKEIIDEARAMLFRNFTEQLKASIAETNATSFSPGSLGAQVNEIGTEIEDTAFGFGKFAFDDHEPEMINAESSGPLPEAEEAVPGFRAPASAATLPEALKFLIDRTGYIKALEEEATPEAFARIENLQELVNAARDSRDRGETLEEFLDHAALVSDLDQYDVAANITLMTLHAAKGLEFPLVALVGLEEGLFPHSRTLMDPDGLEEERRLCYVGMTRAMDALIVSRARYRRRYGNDMPEASIPSRFLEEIPPHLFEDLGGRTQSKTSMPQSYDFGEKHYSYEDEDQSANRYGNQQSSGAKPKSKGSYGGNAYNSVDNIAEFFASRGKKFSSSNAPPKAEPPSGKRSFRPGQKVRHPKYGEGTVFKREGEGESAKITVQFPRFGLKKLVEKYAQLEKA
jgi:DNA helicase-2/ATP-dependent DNA helicase PcrA